MPNNNQANDITNPPAITNNDFEDTLFSDIEVYDLFWLRDRGKDNPPYRKTGDNQAGNTKTRTLHNFQPNTKVFQRI